MQSPIVSSPLSFITPVVLTGSPPSPITAMSVDSTVVPYVIEADQSYTQVEITTIPVSGVYGSTVVNNAPSSPSSGVVTFTGTVNIDLEEGNTVVQFISRNYNPATILWIALSSHNVGDRLVDDNGYVQEALIVTGPSGATKPVTFTVAGEANDVNLDITGIAISNSILTVTAANSLTVGQVLYLYDLQVATFLNGVTVTVTSATGSAFTASYSYGSPGNPATYPPTLDSGLAGIVTQDGGVTWVNQGLYEVSPIVRFTIIPFISGSSSVIGPPSAINAYKSQVACRVEWLMPAFAGTVGTKVMLSTDSAGVNPPYVQYGDVVPVTAVSRVSTQTLTPSPTPAMIPRPVNRSSPLPIRPRSSPITMWTSLLRPSVMPTSSTPCFPRWSRTRSPTPCSSRSRTDRSSADSSTSILYPPRTFSLCRGKRISPGGSSPT